MTNQRIVSISVRLNLLTFCFLTPMAESFASDARVHRKIIATTPSRLEEPVEEVSGSFSVLSTPEIEAQNPTTAPEVLRDLPGINVKESGTMGESASIRLRGSEASQTLILLDGIRLNSPWRGGFNIGNFTFDEIAQIEVLRGGQSALYGSDAIGGVVQLKTMRGKGVLKTSLTQEVGSESTFRERLSVDGENSKLDYSMTLSRTDTEGQFSHDGYGGTHFSGKTGLELRDSGRLELIFRVQEDKKELAIDVPPSNPVQIVPDENRILRRKFRFYSLQYHDQMGQNFELSWKAALIDTALEENNPSDPSALTSNSYFEDTGTQTVILDFQQNYSVNDFNIFSFGLEQHWDTVISNIDIDIAFSNPPASFTSLGNKVDQSRRNTAFYLQNLFKWQGRFTFQAGARVDDNSGFGTVTTPHAAMAYQFKPSQTILRGSWGKGFRAPTIQELYFPVFGDENLEPEKSENWEIGFRQKINGKAIVFDIVYFQNKINLIEKNPTGIQNIYSLTKGIESLFQIQPFQSLMIKANYTYLDAKSLQTGEPLFLRPKHQGNINLLYIPTVAIVANIGINMLGSQALPIDFRLLDGSLLQDKNPGYTRVDFSTSYNHLRGFQNIQELRFSLKIRNLFDRAYQEVPGFPAPGIGFFAGITAVL